MIPIPPRHETKVTALAAAGVSQLCAIFYYRPWLLHLNVPLDVSGDALQKLQLVTAAVRDGWILHNSQIGLPGGGQHLDFPRYDSLNYALIKLLTWFVRDAIVATNLYFLLGYGLVALTAAWVLRCFGVRPLWSMIGAVAYAWLPYHQLRGFDHFTNAAYWLIPVALWFVRRTWYPPGGIGSWSRQEWAGWLGFGVLLELQNPYYAIFLVVLAASVALMLAVMRGVRGSRTALLQTGALIATVFATFMLEQLPRWLFEAANGRNAIAVFRPANGPSEFALSLADLVNPSPDHPITWLARWTQSAAAIRGYDLNERVVAALPSVGLLGLGVCVCSLLRRAKRLVPGDEASRVRQWAGAIILVALAWCHEGALCTLISESGFGLVRAWNRMSVYIAFAAILAAFSWFDSFSRRFSVRSQRVMGAIVLVLSLAEQLGAHPRNSFTESSSRWNEAKRLTRAVAADGKRHRAFVLPYVEYPEAGPMGAISDYDHFLLVIASDQIDISYGSMRGRGAHYFSGATAELHGAELVSYLRDGAFDTVILDMFAKSAPARRDELEAVLGGAAARTARFLAYRLGAPTPAAPTDSSYRAYALGNPINFRDAANRRFLELNFSGYEADGTWTLGGQAALRLRTGALPSTLMLDLEGELFSDPAHPQRVRVLFDGAPLCELDSKTRGTAGSSRWSCRFSRAPNARAPATHVITFEIQHPVSPAALLQSPDLRPLGLRLMSLTLGAAEE